MSEKVTVRWKSGDSRGPKGQIIEDTRARRKIVFVANEHRGRRPANDEVTEAWVTYEDKPEDPNRGFLKVVPVFPADPDALSKEKALALLLQMARDAGPVFDSDPDGGCYINVDLPGWQGTLHGHCMTRSFRETPLSGYWRFIDEESSSLYMISEPGADGVPISTGIWLNRHGTPRLENWAQAVIDLGQPEEVKLEVGGWHISLRWRDKYGGFLVVGNVRLADMIAAVGVEVENIQQTPFGKITGTIKLLNGRLVVKDVSLAETECPDSTSSPVIIRRARLVTEWKMPQETKRRVAELLRKDLHTEEWHKQNLLATQLSESATWSSAVWHNLREVQECVKEKFLSLHAMYSTLKYVYEARTRIEELRLSRFLLDASLVDPIYLGVEVDDAEEVVRLEVANRAMIERVDQAIHELEAAIEAVRVKRADPEFRAEVWMAAQEMLEDLKKNYSPLDNLMIGPELERAVKAAEYKSHPIEDILYFFECRIPQRILQKINCNSNG